MKDKETESQKYLSIQTLITVRKIQISWDGRWLKLRLSISRF